MGSCFAILYVPLRYCGLSFTDFGILVSLNFITQVASDVLFSKPVEKYGFRPLPWPLPSSARPGWACLPPPLLFPRALCRLCAGMFLFAAAACRELLLGPFWTLPIPEGAQGPSMSMLHSFFAWGQIFVVLATTGLLAVWGAARWQWIVLLWAAPPWPAPCCSTACRWPVKRRRPPLPLRALARKACSTRCWRPSCWSGAAEVTMAQWASALWKKGPAAAEAGGRRVGRVLLLADACAGAQRLCGAGRARAAAPAAHRRQHAAAVLYVVCALAQTLCWGVLACGLMGLCVSLLWPGAIILASGHPLPGAAMFALLSRGR